MTITELKHAIMHKELKNFYVFTGEEIGIMNIYLEQMSKVYGLPITRAESVASIYSQCTTRSMFGNTTSFYVIRNDNDITKQEKVYETLSAEIKSNIIVLLYDKIDSRLKFGKFAKPITVEFEKLAPSVLKSYIKKALPLSDRNIDTLISVCNGSYDLCMLEVDKIKHYGCADENKAFDELLDCGVIYQPEEYDVFKFTDAYCSGKISEALHIADTLLINGTPSVTILGTLYNSLKSVLLIQCCNGGNISDVTGLDKGAIYFNKKYVGNFKTEDLVYSIKVLAETVDNIKKGKVEDAYALKYAICNVW